MIVMKLRRRPSSPPPVVAPGVNTRVSIVVEGVRYGGRVDDVEGGALVIAAPDVQLAARRPVMLEWRDAAGVWVMPAEVVTSRLHPFPTTSLRPAGASECVSADAHGDSPVRLSGRIVESPRLPRGTRVPVTTANVDGGDLVIWTILPLERGDILDIVASTGGSSLQQARVRVTGSAPQSGSWLARVSCRPATEADPSAAALVGAVRARTARSLAHA
jgi:hypothetical protein